MFAVYSTESKPEFYMNSSVVYSNLQHGVFLENLRNYVIVNSSSITYNGYGAGIRIYSGAGTRSVVCFTVIALQNFVLCGSLDCQN